jgi:radical SAM superfamily enzyme YgiQ (UPF0313 family)
MAKSILVSYAGYPHTPSSLMPDNGLASLAGSLIKSGHEVKIVDYGTIETMRRLIPIDYSRKLGEVYDVFQDEDNRSFSKIYNFLKLNYIDNRLVRHQRAEVKKMAHEISDLVAQEGADFVGFKLWGGDGFHGATEMIRQLKQDHPRLHLFGGGPQAYLFQGRIFERMPIDAICYDEGEKTIVQLAEVSERKRQLQDVDNILYIEKGKVKKTALERLNDLDALPMPIYDTSVYPALVSDQKLKIFVIDESRGCVNSCPFCPQSAKYENRFRAKSPERTVGEIERLVNQFNAKLFRFGGQMTPGRLHERIAQRVLQKQLDIKYSSFGYVGTMKDVNFELLRRAGLTAVFYGIESGSDRLLRDVLGKRTTSQDAEVVLRRTKEAGIKAVASFIYPTPTEDATTRQETLDFIGRTKPDSVLVYFPGLYPNTTWGKNPEQFGFKLLLSPEEYERAVMDYKIKTIFPPRFWDALPYKSDGKSFRKITRETEEFVKEVKKHNIPLFLTDEHFLIEKRSNISPHNLIKSIGRQFYSGDLRGVAELVNQTK